MVEFYDKYITRLETEGNGPELLAELCQEAARSLRTDPPERALTLTGQMVAALFLVAQRQIPPQRSIIDIINLITEMMVDYLERLSWHQRAIKTEAGWVYEKFPHQKLAGRKNWPIF